MCSFVRAINELGAIMTTETDNYVGIDYSKIDEIKTIQIKSGLCWAAGIQMLLKYENLTLMQEQIVGQVLDPSWIDDYDRRIRGEEIEDLLRKIKIVVNSKTYKLDVTEYSDCISEKDILKELERKKPILLSYDKHNNKNNSYGHIVVITGANYFVSNYIKTIRQLIVLDPEYTIGTVKQTYENDNLKNILTSINVLWTIDKAICI